jgi:Cu/Ag efflux pump CusA
VRSAVVYATFAITLIFLPVLGLTGIAGSLFSPLAKSYLFATLASLVVVLTVTPALSLLLLAKAKLSQTETAFERFLKSKYAKFLGFIPELKEGHFIVQSSIDEN